MADICLEVDISPRQIERCFHPHYGICPLAYVNLRRLNEARSLLLRGRMGTSVTDAALASDFSHWGASRPSTASGSFAIHRHLLIRLAVQFDTDHHRSSVAFLSPEFAVFQTKVNVLFL
ncbi:MAG: helix-turn-helix domain-containing protein [Candidatus Competibacteraceae bacterium]|nr:helix-turn-helix domain-containing protein [Candidatus Competibacteraceae bacterium]